MKMIPKIICGVTITLLASLGLAASPPVTVVPVAVEVNNIGPLSSSPLATVVVTVTSNNADIRATQVGDNSFTPPYLSSPSSYPTPFSLSAVGDNNPLTDPTKSSEVTISYTATFAGHPADTLQGSFSRTINYSKNNGTFTYSFQGDQEELGIPGVDQCELRAGNDEGTVCEGNACWPKIWIQCAHY